MLAGIRHHGGRRLPGGMPEGRLLEPHLPVEGLSL